MRPIQLSMVELDWFRPVEGHESWTFLPSIGEGASITLEGSIKVRIREREEYENPESGVVFIRNGAIHLNAIMPWLERKIPNFGVRKVVEIRYPCELRNFNTLATVAQGSQSKLSFEVRASELWELPGFPDFNNANIEKVYNHGNVSIGPNGHNSRVIEIDVSFPASFGELESESGQWHESVTLTPSSIRERVGLEHKQQLRVHNHAPIYQHVTALFKLYLGKPKQGEQGGESEINLVHEVEIKMQVSDHYTVHPGASFLLVTNSETGGDRAQSIRRFINNSLHMEVDTWNISLYAGLDYRDQYSGAWENILSRYHGRSIIFLANYFDFFGQGRKTILDMCNPEVIATAAAGNTNLLFLDTPDFEPHKKLITEVFYWPDQPVSSTRVNISQSHHFNSISDFTTSVIQQKQHYNLSHERYTITLPRKWYDVVFSRRPATLAQKVAKQLRRELPTENFLVTFHDRSPLDIIVVAGISHQNSMTALERGPAPAEVVDTSTSDGLPPTEAYKIMEAIALHDKIALLWNTVAASPGNGNVATLRSQFVINALNTSLIKATNREVELLLHKAPWPDKLLPPDPSKQSPEELRSLFASHLPTLHAILFHPLAPEPTVAINDNVQLVLSYALAATLPQSKRQIAAQVFTPTHNRRRRTRAFLRAGIAILLKSKRFTETQISDFFSEADRVYKSSNPTKRNTSAAVMWMMAGLTKQSEHAVVRGKQDATDVMRGSSYVAPGEWDSRAASVKERSRRVTEEATEARKVLERMLVS